MPKNQVNFQSVQKEISQSSISKIYEDSYGFLWLGTPNGLYKYDGVNFDLFEKTTDGITGLSNGYIMQIFENQEKELYIGSYKGLSIYDRELNIVKPFPFKGEGKIIRTKDIISIEDKDEHLFFGTANSGVFRYNQVSGKTQHLIFEQKENTSSNYNYVLKTALLDENTHLVFTQAAIYFVDSNLNIIKQVNKDTHIRSVLRLNKNEYLLGSQNGDLYFVKIDKNYDVQISKKTISKDHAILSLEQYNTNEIWIGSENDGLFIYTKSTDSLIRYRADIYNKNSISGNSIWSLHKAKNEVMWIGLFKRGLNFFDTNYHKFKSIKTNPLDSKSLSNNVVNCFLEDEKGNIWIGTDGGGLNYWNRTENSFLDYSLANGKLNTNVVLSILEDTNKQLWVGSWANGLAIFEPGQESYKVLNTKNSFLKSDNVSDLLQDKKGRIWIVTQFGGVQVYFPDSGEHINIDLRETANQNYIHSAVKIEEDHQGNLWVGTQNAGVIKLTEKEEGSPWTTSHYHSFSENHKLSDDFVNTISIDSTGGIWVATQSGFNEYDPVKDTFNSITKKDGLINDAIKGILKDDNNFLWLSTSKGITSYSPEDNSILNYDSSDGLQGDEFNSDSFYKTKKGEFMFGGSNGFNIFNPLEIQKSSDKPKVIINSLKVFNSTINPNDKTKILNKHISQIDSLTILYSDAVVDFEYSTLTLSHSEKVKYAYYLQGFETEWNYVGTRKSATYTNLNPGAYTLKIKSTNSDGVWNNNETKLHITVVPPFWKTIWFLALLIIITALLIYLFHFLKVRSFKKNQILLEERIEERTKELVEQKNKLIDIADELSSKNEEIQRFAFAVSHDLKSPLSNIKGITNIIPIEFGLKDFPDMENYLEMINISCDTMNDLIADITKIAKLGKIENKKEILDTNEIIDLAKTLVSSKLNIQNVKLKVTPNLPSIYGDRNRMIQVFGNLIDNAIKYMGDQAEPIIYIDAKEEQNTVQFVVKDNGSGMDENALKKLFSPFERFHADIKGTGLGLYMIKQIVESHDGKIKASSEGLGKGSTFSVYLKEAF